MDRNQLWPLLLILLLAAGLRLSGLTSDSLWLDESFQSITDAVGERLPDFLHPGDKPYLFRYSRPQPIPKLLANFRQVDPLCPPLYAVCLNRWMTWVGMEDFAIRALSVLFSLVSLASIYFFTIPWLGLPTAIFATLLQAISPFDIYYAQEARMYSLNMLASCVSNLSLAHLLFLPNKKNYLVVLYMVGTWALINSHYTGLFTVLFQVIFGLSFCIVHRSVQDALRLSSLWAGVILLCLPWFDLFRQTLAIHSSSFYVSRLPSLWWPWLALLRIPCHWIEFLSGKRVYTIALPLYITSAVFLLAGLISGFRLLSNWMPLKIFVRRDNLPIIRAKNPAVLTSSAFIFILSWAIMPALFIWVLDVVEQHKVIEISRYLIATTPSVFLLAGAGIVWLSKISPRFKILIMVHALFALLNNAWSHYVPQREPWKEMAKTVEKVCEPSDLILVSQYYDIVCLDRYLNSPRQQIGISPTLGADYIAKQLQDIKRFWLLTAQEGESAAELIPIRFNLKQKTDFNHGLHLRLFEENKLRF